MCGVCGDDGRGDCGVRRCANFIMRSGCVLSCAASSFSPVADPPPERGVADDVDEGAVVGMMEEVESCRAAVNEAAMEQHDPTPSPPHACLHSIT